MESAEADQHSQAHSQFYVEDDDGEHRFEDHHHHPILDPERDRFGLPYNPANGMNVNDGGSTMNRADTSSCGVVILSFWLFGAMSLILGVYGPTNMRLGWNSSVLLQPNALFVQNIKVEKLVNSKSGMMLFGFQKLPVLDVVTTWSELHNISISNYSHREWLYYLNKGSKLNISYSVNSWRETSTVLAIAHGLEGLAKWLEDPAYPNTTLLWKIIHGRGMIQHDILKSSSYYVALGNLEKSEAVEVQFNISIHAMLYDKTTAFYQCSLDDGACSIKLDFPKGNVAVLTSESYGGKSNKELYVKLSYEPRWITYIAGIVGMMVLVLVSSNFMKKSRRSRGDGFRGQYGQMDSESDRNPLLSHKDDVANCGSSYDRVLHATENPVEGMPLKDGDEDDDDQRLCVICFEAPKDCFFLPCGHCATCYTCGTRVAEATGKCPICRMNTEKVSKIYTV